MADPELISSDWPQVDYINFSIDRQSALKIPGLELSSAAESETGA